ncbi:hypothetical protein CHISP_0800 [Chitinispirillum alkaliphilum]|nr:hypothetical protein CHISP_0800 [Chitinispirillum alkaliphilum]
MAICQHTERVLAEKPKLFRKEKVGPIQPDLFLGKFNCLKQLHKLLKYSSKSHI